MNDELQIIGGFKTEERGLIEVKVRRECVLKMLSTIVKGRHQS